MISSIYEVRECPECSGGNLSYLEERDQVVCRDCGLVYEPLTLSEEKKSIKGSALKKTSKSRPVSKLVKKSQKVASSKKTSLKKTAKKRGRKI